MGRFEIAKLTHLVPYLLVHSLDMVPQYRFLCGFEITEVTGMILDLVMYRLHVCPQVAYVGRPVIAELAGELLDALVLGFDVDLELLPGRGLVAAQLAGEPVRVDVHVEDVSPQRFLAVGDEVALVAEGEPGMGFNAVVIEV